MRRTMAARMQANSTTTPATGPPAETPLHALEEDGALRAQAFAIPIGLAGADDDDADDDDDDDADDAAYDEAQVDDDDEVRDDDGDAGFEMLTNHRGLPVTMSNTVCLAQPLARRARKLVCCGLPLISLCTTY